MPINELRSITTFIRTVELGSLSKAATAQQISPQAASKALGQLEQLLRLRASGVLHGPNGTGKSNVLEALAIIFRDLIAKERKPHQKSFRAGI